MSNQANNQGRQRRHLGSVSEISFAHDLAGNFTFLNHAGELISGYSCAEVRRMNIAEMVAPEIAAQVREQIARLFQARLGPVYEIDIITKDGRRVALEVSMQVVSRAGGSIEVEGIAVPSVLRNHLPPRAPRCVDPEFWAWIHAGSV